MKASLRAGIEKVMAATLMVACLGAAVGAGGGPGRASAAANPANNPYPYAKSGYWAWQNRPDLPANLGLPKDWADNASRQGWPVGPYPRHGDIAVFQPGMLGADMQEGHVAVVEQVFNDNTYSASQMDEGDYGHSAAMGEVHRRTFAVVSGTRFIHYLKDSRTTWGFAGGQSGWTAKDLGEGNMGGAGWFYPLAGSDPQLVSPELDVPLAGYNAVEVDMVLGAPVADPTVQMFFATAAHPGFAEANSAVVTAQADGMLHRYSFYFGDNPHWQGDLTRLRFDPTGPGTQGGVRVDRIRLVHSEAGATYSVLGEQPGGGRSRP